LVAGFDPSAPVPVLVPESTGWPGDPEEPPPAGGVAELPHPTTTKIARAKDVDLMGAM
jgi:hypothetical protein